MILAVQCGVGSPGSKPVTQLKYPSGPFYGLVDTGNNKYGINDGGIWQLNYTPEDGIPTDDGQPVQYSVRLNASDLGYPGNLKKIMYVYSVMSSSASCSTAPKVFLKPDEQQEFSVGKNLISKKTIRTPVKCRCQGTYWTVGLDSNIPFTLLSMSVNFSVRPMGISNG
jgi:hypothetical protein